MSRYIKKHKRQFAGVALPIFFLFVLSAVGMSVFPGWLKPIYGVPGTSCDTSLGDSSGLFNPACDVCNGEVCTLNTNDEPQCAAPIVDFTGTSITSFNFDPLATPNPQCPIHFDTITVNGNADLSTTIFPGCWNVCTPTIDTQNTQLLLAVCSPSTTFCSGISGGDQSNDCRTGECQVSPTPDPLNQSGCDYQLVPETTNDECVLCSDTGTGIPPACGNGICEGAEGEDCVTCSVDCLIPGFEDVCPLTSGGAIADGCFEPPAVSFVTFSGPPYNQIGDQDCEDGDLCTDNECESLGGDVCLATLKSCLPDADFCCPTGCSPPTTGTCREVTGAPIPGCDPDCYVPQDCVPTPSPTPTPPPFTGLCLTGSSLIGGDGNPAPACDCSLNPDAPMAPGKTGAMGLMGLVMAAFVVTLRKKANS